MIIMLKISKIYIAKYFDNIGNLLGPDLLFRIGGQSYQIQEVSRHPRLTFPNLRRNSTLKRKSEKS